MANFNSTAKLSRRELAATLAGAAVLVTPALAAPVADAALLTLGAKLEAAWAAERRADKFGSDDEIATASNAVLAVIAEIEAAPATTLEGLRVKARAILCCHSGAYDGVTAGKTTDHRLAEQIIGRLLAA
jgi:hypothetical protein